MKKIVACLFAAALCLCSLSAFAQQIEPADKGRILPGLPPGMVASCTASSGRVDIVIDTDRTDWDMVATAAKKSGSLVIHPGIARPVDMLDVGAKSDYYWYSGYSAEQSEARTFAELANVGWGGERNAQTACSIQGIAIGRYDEGTGLFIPQVREAGAGDGFAVRWIGENGASRTERVRVSVKYTKITPVYTRRQDAEGKYIAANVSLNGRKLAASSVSGVSVGDGHIVYRLKDVPAGSEVYTAVSAPSWLKVAEGWKAYRLASGKMTEMPIYKGADFGLKNSCVVVPQRIDRSEMLYKNDWAIQWVDDKGAVQAVFCLKAEFHVDNPKLTIAYDEETEPLAAGSFHWETYNPLSGLSAAYDGSTGVFRLSIDEKKLPANGKTNLSQTYIDATVDVPANAVRCNVYRIQGDVIYGDSGEAQWQLGTLEVKPGKPMVVPELTGCLFFGEVSAKLSNGKTMTYFVSPMMVGEYGGTTLIFEWLDAKGERIGKKRSVTLLTDSYQLFERENPSLSGEPDGLVDEPEIQTQEGGVYTASAMLPQLGDHVLRYEIALLDANGCKAQPDAPVLVYLPYPDGRTMDECLNDDFIVYHQLADGSYETYSLANGKLTLTPQGLCMEVTSFSPYFLNWKEGKGNTAAADSAAQLPQTGDSSSLAVCITLLMASAASMAVLLRRKRSA